MIAARSMISEIQMSSENSSPASENPTARATRGKVRSFFVGFALLAMVCIIYWAAAGRVLSPCSRVVLCNTSGKRLHHIRLELDGDTRSIDSIEPEGRVECELHLQSESSIGLEFMISGDDRVHRWRGGYLEPDSYVAELSIYQDATIREQTSITPVRVGCNR